MPTTTSSIECPICLDKFRDPVVTPCGHLACHPCMKTLARRSGDPYKALCPTCRAPFPTVTPDLSIVPKKYHVFISPPLRRVFFEESNLAREEMTKLKAEVNSLNALVTSLKRDKDLLMDRCDSAQWAVTRLTADERTARLARDEAREDARVAKQNLKKLRKGKENQARNCRCAREQSSRSVTLAKRTSGHASLDDSSSSSGWSDVSVVKIKVPNGARSIKPMPKRAKLGPARATAAAAASEPNVQQSSGNATSRTLYSLDPSSSESESDSDSESESESSPEPGRRDLRRMPTSTGPLRFLDEDSSSDDPDEADNRNERSNMEDFHAARLLPSPIRNTRDASILPPVFPRAPRRSDRLRRVRESGRTGEIPSESTIVPGV